VPQLRDATSPATACGRHRQKREVSQTKSGTAILVKSTIPARPGDGPLWAKPDGKALAVALTIGDGPLILLAAHLPHTDVERIAFLEEVAEHVERAATAHALTPDPKATGVKRGPALARLVDLKAALRRQSMISERALACK
jgi:hypothetical protein